MKKASLILILVSSFVYKSYGQIDTVALNNFSLLFSPKEKEFIGLLKGNKIDSCIMYFSKDVKNEFGLDSLKNELTKLHKYFLNYPNPEVDYSVSHSSNGIGAFGHDVEGNLEVMSLYCFVNKQGDKIHSFALYYTNAGNQGIIKNFNSWPMPKLTKKEKRSNKKLDNAAKAYEKMLEDSKGK